MKIYVRQKKCLIQTVKRKIKGNQDNKYNLKMQDPGTDGVSYTNALSQENRKLIVGKAHDVTLFSRVENLCLGGSISQKTSIHL